MNCPHNSDPNSEFQLNELVNNLDIRDAHPVQLFYLARRVHTYSVQQLYFFVPYGQKNDYYRPREIGGE